MRVSIVSLIYRSPTLADWVYESIHAHTPMISRGEAEFFFVANDPTPGLLRHLNRRGYPYRINLNVRRDERELFDCGYAGPEHMSRVYRGYNEGIRAAAGDYVVLLNSDNYVSPDWLENLLKYSDRSRVVVSTLVEREHPVFSVFPGAVHAEFGGSVESFDKAAFLEFVSRTKRTGLEAGGAYMPVLLHRDIALQAGLYPTGNVAGQSYDEVSRYGDEAFFDRLRELGVQHYTALDSIVYHLKEGEREDQCDDSEGAADHASPDAPRLTDLTPYPPPTAIEMVRDSMAPTARHEQLVAAISSDGELRRRQEQVSSDAAAAAAAHVLHEQANRFKALVIKLFGATLAPRVLRIIHSVSWISRPARRWLAVRKSSR